MYNYNSVLGTIKTRIGLRTVIFTSLNIKV